MYEYEYFSLFGSSAACGGDLIIPRNKITIEIDFRLPIVSVDYYRPVNARIRRCFIGIHGPCRGYIRNDTNIVVHKNVNKRNVVHELRFYNLFKITIYNVSHGRYTVYTIMYAYIMSKRRVLRVGDTITFECKTA